MKIEKHLVGSGLTSLEKNVISRITADSWFELVRERIPAGQPAAENPLDPDLPSGREEGIAKVVAAKLEAMGFSVRLAAKQEGHPNVIGRLQGTTGEKTLIVNDHLRRDIQPGIFYRAISSRTKTHPGRTRQSAV